MNNLLIIRLTDNAELPIEWLHWGEDAISADVGSGSYDDLAKLPAVKSIALLLPTSRVSFAETEIPSRNPQQVKLAAQSLMEENLINEVENNHIVTFRSKYPRTSIAAIDKDYLAQTLETLDDIGIKPDYAIPDCLVLPISEQGWTIYQADQQFLLRQERFTGIQIDQAWLDGDALASLSRLPLTPPQSITIYMHHSAVETDAFNMKDIESHHINLQSHQNLLTMFADQDAWDHEIDFLIDDFKPSHQRDNSWINWRLPVYATAASLLFISFILFFQGISLEHNNKQLLEQIDDKFRQTLPHVTTIVDYQLQFEREINRLKQTSGHGSQAMAHLYEVLSRIKTAEQLSIIHLSLSDNRLTLDLMAPDLESAKRFMSSLDDSRLYQTQLMSAQNNGDKTRIRIHISPAAT